MGRWSMKSVPQSKIRSMLDFTKNRPSNYLFSNNVSNVLSTQEWRSFPIHSISKESHDTLRLRIRLPNHNDRLGLPVASCVTLRGFKEDGKKEIIRPYTPVSDSALKGFAEFVIKIYTNGEMSQYISSLYTGDNLELMGPWSKISYPFELKTNIAMICGGSGITPMIQILKEISLHKNIDTRGITLINANKTYKDKICLSDLLSIKTILEDRLYVWDVLEYSNIDKPPTSFESDTLNPNIIKIGRIDKQLLETYLPEPDNETLIMICGPDGMMENICGPKIPQENGPPAQGPLGGFLKDLGYTEDMVYKF